MKTNLGPKLVAGRGGPDNIQRQHMSASNFKLAAGILVLAGAIALLLLRPPEPGKLKTENDALRQQLAQLQADNASLSNRLAESAVLKRRSSEQLTELLKLRNDVGLLQRQVGELGQLREEVRRLQAAPHDTKLLQASVDALDQQQQAAMVSLNHARQAVLAFIMYADENQQQFPTSFDQAAPFFKDGLEPIAMNFEIVYVGSVTNITNAAGTVVLREKHPSQTPDGKWHKTYGFADGHAENHTEPDGNFDEWESQHIISPPANP